MRKDYRRELLEKMLKANETITNTRGYSCYEYSKFLIRLLNTKEYEYAKAIVAYEDALEDVEDADQELGAYILYMGREDNRSSYLRGNVDYFSQRKDSLYDAYKKAVAYFKETDIDETLEYFEV